MAHQAKMSTYWKQPELDDRMARLWADTRYYRLDEDGVLWTRLARYNGRNKEPWFRSNRTAPPEEYVPCSASEAEPCP